MKMPVPTLKLATPLAGLLAALTASNALAAPSAQSRAAGIIVHQQTAETTRPRPVQTDRLERSTLERAARARKPAAPTLPAEQPGDGGDAPRR